MLPKRKVLNGMKRAAEVLAFIQNKVRNDLAQLYPERKAQLLDDSYSIETKLRPALAMVVVRPTPASLSYLKRKRNFAKKAGLTTRLFQIEQQNQNLLSKTKSILQMLNKNQKYNGIILQLPLPEQLSSEQKNLLDMIDPAKDVDCLGEFNRSLFQQNGKDTIIKPCAVQAVFDFFTTYRIQYEGKKILIIGKGKLIGEPIYQCFKKENLDVRVMDKNDPIQVIKQEAKTSDIVISGTGKPDLLEKQDFKNKQCVIIDFGVTKDLEKPDKIRGDIKQSVKKSVSQFYSPVPKGMGPMVVCSLMKNVYKAWHQQKFL